MGETGEQRRVLVAGGGGFIGHNLVKHLKERGHWVRAADMRKPEYESSPADEFLEVDLRSFEECVRAVHGVLDVYQLAAEPEVESGQIVELMEITMRNLLSEGQIDLRDFLARADLLAAAGKTVLISDYFEYYRLAAYLTRYTTGPIAVTMGVSSLRDLFSEQYYAKLEGGILEAFGRLFTKDLRLYVYPLRDAATGQLMTVENVEMPADLRNLYRYLLEHGRVRQLDNFDQSVLHIFSRDVLKRIKAYDASWQEMVPPEIAEVIKRRGFFGYREEEITDGTLTR